MAGTRARTSRSLSYERQKKYQRFQNVPYPAPKGKCRRLHPDVNCLGVAIEEKYQSFSRFSSIGLNARFRMRRAYGTCSRVVGGSALSIGIGSRIRKSALIRLQIPRLRRFTPG